MKIRLSGGVVTAGRRAWAAGRSGPVELVDDPALPLGAPVALGPGDAPMSAVCAAVDSLSRLVTDGGAVAAGAGVDLGSGFRSARLAGARGDQRDAVLAALRVLGVAQADRLGDRAGFLVALFGPAVTKRVGAAAATALGDGRWAAVALASAASDVLWPEQLELVLALAPPAEVDIVPGPASALAQHLRVILSPLPEPRRLDLLLDLWAQVSAHHAELARRSRLLATQGRRNRTEDIRKRRKYHDDELILSLLRGHIHDPEQRLADVARWTPPRYYWQMRLTGLLQDAFAATVLLRTATAVGQHGLEEGLARSAELLGGTLPLLAAPPVRRVQGLTGLPGRPGTYVREIHHRLSSERPRDSKFDAFVRPRLARARDFAFVIMEEAKALLENPSVQSEALRSWGAGDLRNWREQAGYVRPAADWDGIPVWSAKLLGEREALSQRLAPGAGVPGASGASGALDALDVELVGDLLWYADLVDALAVLHGHDRAQGPLGMGFPWLDYDPTPTVEPLTPQLDSVTLAVSGAAQLVALGGTPPKRVRAWREFTEGLLDSTSIAEAITGEFTIPAPLAAADGTTVAGTGLRLRVARNARTLAEWSNYMGNCIAGPYYVDRARAGRSVLTGLYDKSGVLIVNAELVPRRPAARGWRIDEIQARFNNTPEEALERRFRDWVEAVPAPEASESAPPLPDEPAPARARRRPSPPRLVEDVGPALAALARQAWEDPATEVALDAFAALAGTAPGAALGQLRRLQPGPLAELCARTLDAGTVSLADLWSNSGVRPLRAAVAAIDGHAAQLALLFGEPPMAKSLRRLVKLPAIADAYALDLVARSVRKAIGDLAFHDDQAIARALGGRTTEPLLCALTVMVTCRAPGIALMPVTSPGAFTVPGYPATTLDDPDGPWQTALSDARELGADTAAFWDEVTERGLRVPASWLAGASWTSLWSRAHR